MMELEEDFQWSCPVHPTTDNQANDDPEVLSDIDDIEFVPEEEDSLLENTADHAQWGGRPTRQRKPPDRFES